MRRFGIIFACALGDEMLRRAFAGDLHAQRFIQLHFPDVPRSECRAERVHRLRELADRIRADRPLDSVGQIARLIAEASERLEQGRSLEGLIAGEAGAPLLDVIKQTLGEILRWAPPTKNRRSLGRKQIEGIIGGRWKS